jgi:hypothetical protein
MILVPLTISATFFERAELPRRVERGQAGPLLRSDARHLRTDVSLGAYVLGQEGVRLLMCSGVS